MVANPYCCIYCKSSLEEAGNGLRCTGCAAHFEVREGLPILSEKERYWCSLPRDAMRRLNNDAKEGYWADALRKHIRSNTLNYIFDDSRMELRRALPDLCQMKVLDVGSMWGDISIPISRYAQEVYAVDTTYETLELLAIRARQEHINNLKIALASAHKLPFNDNYFDVVLLIGVLEWLGSDYDFVVSEDYGARRDRLSPLYSNPTLLQREALSQAYRTLKPGGNLLIGIENRFFYKYFFGSPEAHTLAPFLSVLPRPIADMYLRLSKNKRYTEYTYSYFEYKNMLKKIGFKKHSFYAAIPSYREIDAVIPLDGERQIREYYRDYCLSNLKGAERLILQMILNLGVMRYLVPSFLILAEK